MVAPRTASLALACLVLVSRCVRCLPAEQEICDDGKFKIWEDVTPVPACRGKWPITAFYEPAGQSDCSSGRSLPEPTQQCMDKTIHYEDPIPSSGDYRPLAPKYGEYSSLPPQRWLHSLYLGGIVFLYHPCTDEEQVSSLRQLARSCLWRHIITPSPHLTSDHPLAMVSWGCVYLMSWVNPPEVRLWLREHAMNTSSSIVTSNGIYDEGLIQDAAIVTSELDSEICPDHSPTHHPPHTHPSTDTPHTAATDPSDEGTSSLPPNDPPQYADWSDDTEWSEDTDADDSTLPPCRNTTCSHVARFYHSPGFVLLMILISSVALSALGYLLYKACCHGSGRGRGRYKSVSRFIPVSFEEGGGGGGGGGPVAIPEFGLPKSMPAEREKLLSDSEDEF